MEEKINRSRFDNILHKWSRKNLRDLPWRETKDPYRIWLSEIMLQQTQVERVKDYYARFLRRFPTVRSLSAASREEVLEHWRGLGYYRRARNLHETAKIISGNYQGKFPRAYEELQKLPGVGSYTAAAIASFAYGEDVPALDTNLHRVFRHLFGEKFWVGMKPKEQFEFAKSYIPKGEGALFNHALMDLGASGILDKAELHEQCPFQAYCKGENIYRARRQKKLVLHDAGLRSNASDIKVAVGVLIHRGKILIAKRRATDVFGGYWEFPGGKLEAGEDERACLKREMQEELGIEVAVRPSFYKIFAPHMGKNYLLSFHRCSLLLGEPRALHAETIKWANLAELPDYKFPPQNYKVIDMLKKRTGMLRYS